MPERSERPRPANAAIAGVLVVAGVALLPLWRPVDPAVGAPIGTVGYAPSGVTAALRETAEPGDRIYLPQPWASWIEFAVPEAAVVLDSRFELFPEPVWQAYLDVAAGRPSWQDQLDEWGVTLVVATDEREGGLLDQLRRDDGWTVVYEDADGVVLERADRAG